MKTLKFLCLLAFTMVAFTSKTQVTFNPSGTVEQLNAGGTNYYQIARFDSNGIHNFVDTLWFKTTPITQTQITHWNASLTAETDPMFDTKLATKSTSNLVEGTNKYYTDTRVRNAISAGTGITYNSTTGTITNGSPDQTVTISSGTGINVTGTYPSFTVTNSAATVTNYGPGGAATITKRWTGIVTPSTSNGYSVDISSAGFSNIVSVQVVAARNTGTVSACPQASLKSYTTSAVVVNITEANPATITILGIPVLSGLPVIFANTSGLTLHVTVEGN